MANQKFGVMCRRSGGMLGFAENLLKKDGKVQIFNTKAEAETEADRCRQSMNSPYSSASFNYWAVEL